MSSTELQSKAKASPWWAVAVWVAMLAWWTIPPSRAQLQDHARGPFSWDWKLHRSHQKVCDARFYDMKQDGAPVERWQLLGFATRDEMPLSHARIREQQLRAVSTSICARLRKAGDPEPNVEAAVRCDADGRWKILEDRTRNICARPLEPIKTPEAHGRVRR